MAIKLVSTIQRWEGLPTDKKPAGDVAVGSTFDELHTGRRYVFTGMAWVEDMSANLTVGKALELNNELRSLAERTYLEIRAANEANEIEVR